MKISDVDGIIAKMPSARPDLNGGQGKSSPHSSSAKASDDRDPRPRTEVTAPSAERIFFSKAENVNNQKRMVVRQIREVDQTMDQVEKNLQKMKASLEQIKKSYPPYPPGSDERAQALRRFGSLRHLIDQLTVPPPDDGPGQILGNTSSHPNAGDWEFVNRKGSTPIKMGRQPIHSGADGLDLPELPRNASDADLNQAAAKVDKALVRIQKRRADFITDANRIIATISA